MTNEIKSALHHAQERLADLLAKRQEIDKQIVDWKRVTDSLSVVSEEIDTSIPPDLELPSDFAEKLTLGFTDAIRAVLQSASERVTPTQVRDELVRIGFDLKKYAQPMVPIHNTLKRLEKQGEIIAIKNESGETVAYRWPNAVERVLALDPPPSFGARNSLANTILRAPKRMFAPRGRLNTNRLGGRYNKPRYGGPPVTEDT